MDLRTARLDLVPLAEEHSPALAALYSDPEVARYIGGSRLTPEETSSQVGRFMDVWATHGFGQSAVIERSSGMFIGRVGLHPWTGWDELELGWMIARSHQRRGLATEAAEAWICWSLEHLLADHLIAVIQPENAASISTALRLGFEFERDDQTTWDPVSVYRRPIRPSVEDPDGGR